MKIKLDKSTAKVQVIEPSFPPYKVYLDKTVLYKLKNTDVLNNLQNMDFKMNLLSLIWEISQEPPITKYPQAIASVLFMITGELYKQGNKITCFYNLP